MICGYAYQVTHVVCGEADGQGTAKHTAALQRGIPTVDEQFMLWLIKNGGKKDNAVAAKGGRASASSGRDLKDGEEFEVPRQGADPYVIKNIVCSVVATLSPLSQTPPYLPMLLGSSAGWRLLLFLSRLEVPVKAHQPAHLPVCDLTGP
jgi:hypothetical protein